jgi:hypothetical protein
MRPFQALSGAYKAAQPSQPEGFRAATPELEKFAIQRITSPAPPRSRALPGRRVRPNTAAQDLNTSEFLARFTREAGLNPVEIALLKLVNVKSYADVFILMRCFPSIAELGIRLPMISNAAAMRLGAADASVLANRASDQNRVTATDAHGTLGTKWAVGTTLPPRIAEGGTVCPALPGARIDLRLPSWPVRDQASRGTSVAFASTAAVEHVQAIGNLALPDLSEQFLYWAIKTRTSDPRPSEDGTSLIFAKEALAEIGICHEQFWPYNGTPGSTVAQATASDPSAAALFDASANRFSNATYMRSPVAAAAAAVLAALQHGRAVVISVPVFSDPIFPTGPTNRTTPSGWAYGRVLNPLPRAVVSGGHAVCVVGFEPDPDEPQGGYFIFRNNWGTLWGSQAPSPGNSYAPEPGYGEISASYVDTYLWEMLHF